MEEKTQSLEVSESVKTSLEKMVYWSKFLAIVGYVLCAFMLLGAVAMALTDFNLGGYDTAKVIAVFYVIVGAMYFYPTNCLFIFAKNTKSALDSNNQDELNSGLSKLTSFFTFFGILTAVVLCLYGIFILIGIAGFLV